MTYRHILDKIFRDKQGKVVIWQSINIPLLVWGTATIAARLLRDPWRNASGYIALGAIIIWAGMEILTGDSLFRRLLGALVLSWVLLSSVLG